MAISNAVSLANFTSGDALTVDSANDRVGIASTVPTTTLDVDGTVTATAFVGDGTGITNAGSSLSASSGTQRVVVTSQTSGTMTAAGTNSDLAYNTSTNTLSATTFSGNLTGDVTGNITGATGDFTGNVSVGGTLTYEDVTNVDSVGIVTAGGGVIATGLGVSVASGGVRVTGIVTATSFSGDGSALTGLSGWSQEDTWLYGGG